MNSYAKEKICSTCKETKAISEFHKDKSVLSGIRCECKKCANYRNKLWKRNNTENASRYLQEHKKEHFLYNEEWLKNHPEKIKEYNHKRRARKNNGTGNFSADEWISMKTRYEFTCLSCKRKEPHIVLEPDHVIPLVLGGGNSILNIQPLCSSCNRKKSSKHVDYRSKFQDETFN